MKQAINILMNSSIFIQIYAVLITLSVLTFGWWCLYGWHGMVKVFFFFMLMSNCMLLCEFVDDRRVCSQEERDEWMLKNQCDISKERDL